MNHYVISQNFKVVLKHKKGVNSKNIQEFKTNRGSNGLVDAFPLLWLNHKTVFSHPFDFDTRKEKDTCNKHIFFFFKSFDQGCLYFS